MEKQTDIPNVVIVGGHDQGCKILDYLTERRNCNVVLCICREDDSGEDGIFPSLLSKANFHNIPSIKAMDLNSPHLLTTVKQLSPDIVLSLQNNKVFGDGWIDMMSSRLGIVNIHYAPLPKYSGYWPEMWAIWNNEKQYLLV